MLAPDCDFYNYSPQHWISIRERNSVKRGKESENEIKNPKKQSMGKKQHSRRIFFPNEVLMLVGNVHKNFLCQVFYYLLVILLYVLSLCFFPAA